MWGHCFPGSGDILNWFSDGLCSPATTGLLLNLKFRIFSNQILLYSYIRLLVKYKNFGVTIIIIVISRNFSCKIDVIKI